MFTFEQTELCAIEHPFRRDTDSPVGCAGTVPSIQTYERTTTLIRLGLKLAGGHNNLDLSTPEKDHSLR